MSQITQPKQKPTTADAHNWTHVDLSEGVAYIHLHDSGNRVCRLDRKAELAEDGAAPPLEPTRTIQPIPFDPAVKASTAVQDLKVLVADSLPVHRDQRWMVLSWLLSAFFSGLVRQRALLRVAGGEESGKSTVAELLCCLLCGARQAGGCSPQEVVAKGDPLLVIEQPPSRDEDDPPQASPEDDLPDELLLDLAQRPERSRTLALVTGSGDFEADELNLWAYRVDSSPDLRDSDFPGEHHFADVINHRRRILSGLFQLFAADVLPGLEFRQSQLLEKIRQEFASHNHNHLDPFLALMTVILEALLGTLHGSRRKGELKAWRTVAEWIAAQGRMRQNALVRDKTASFLFFSLAQALRNGDLEVFQSMGDVKVEGERIGFSFQSCPSEMHSLLTSVSQAKGIKLPFETPRDLAAFLEKESSQHEVCVSWSKTKVRRGEPFYEFYKEA